MNSVLVFVLACTCMRVSQAGLPEVPTAVAGRKLLQDSCICTDVVPGMYSCPQQAAFGKCGAAFMVQGLFCQRTCGTCAPCKSCAECYDVVPPGSFLNCQQQALSRRHLLESPPVAQHCTGCSDVQPPGGYTCAQQATFGKCRSQWMVGGCFCQQTCNACPAAELGPSPAIPLTSSSLLSTLPLAGSGAPGEIPPPLKQLLPPAMAPGLNSAPAPAPALSTQHQAGLGDMATAAAQAPAQATSARVRAQLTTLAEQQPGPAPNALPAAPSAQRPTAPAPAGQVVEAPNALRTAVQIRKPPASVKPTPAPPGNTTATPAPSLPVSSTVAPVGNLGQSQLLPQISFPGNSSAPTISAPADPGPARNINQVLPFQADSNGSFPNIGGNSVPSSQQTQPEQQPASNSSAHATPAPAPRPDTGGTAGESPPAPALPVVSLSQLPVSFASGDSPGAAADAPPGQQQTTSVPVPGVAVTG